jgi:hypothetical protein
MQHKKNKKILFQCRHNCLVRLLLENELLLKEPFLCADKKATFKVFHTKWTWAHTLKLAKK